MDTLCPICDYMSCISSDSDRLVIQSTIARGVIGLGFTFLPETLKINQEK